MVFVIVCTYSPGVQYSIWSGFGNGFGVGGILNPLTTIIRPGSIISVSGKIYGNAWNVRKIKILLMFLLQSFGLVTFLPSFVSKCLLGAFSVESSNGDDLSVF